MTAAEMALMVSALRLAALLALPVLAAGVVAGLLSGVLQTATAWSEPVLSYVPRVVAVAIAWGAAAPWIADELVRLARLAWGAP